MNLAYKNPIEFWNCACLIADSGGNGEIEPNEDGDEVDEVYDEVEYSEESTQMDDFYDEDDDEEETEETSLSE